MMRFLLAVAIVLAAPDARADVFALIVTNNHSAEIGRPELRYADDDGAKYYDLFRMLAPDDHVELLTELDRDSAQLFPDARAKAHPPTKAEVAAAVARIAARVRRATTSELYFVFAGHGDVDHGRGFLELRDGRLTSDDLEAILRTISATHAHVILDSCNSFFVLNPRKPGGRQIAVTEQAAASLGARLPGVGVFLSTSAEAEVFEWSELQSGIFSHAVRSGLAGAADANHDGRISYDELRAFVEIATARVKNPLYRPKVFARAPGGNNDAALVDLTTAQARRLDVGAGRVTIRDPDDLPWIDLNEEAGAATTLYLPERWGARAVIDEHVATGAVARRGPNEVLAALFGAPFGPRAMVAWRDEVSHQPEPVYGVSSEDAERMRLLLAQVADSERGTRRVGGIVGMATAGTLVAADLAMPNVDHDLRNFNIACTVGFGISSLVLLFVHSDGEKLYEDYLAKMADPAIDKARVVADTERRLNRLADRARRGRKFGVASGVLVTALSAGMLVATERKATNDQERTLGRLVFGDLGIVGLAMIGLYLQDSPTERMRDLWMHDPDLAQRPRWDVSLAPMSGGGYLSLSARF